MKTRTLRGWIARCLALAVSAGLTPAVATPATVGLLDRSVPTASPRSEESRLSGAGASLKELSLPDLSLRDPSLRGPSLQEQSQPSEQAEQRRAGGGAGVVYRIPVSGVIELGVAPFIERSLREAEAAGVRAAVIELETPGGRLDAAQRIVTAITNAQIPVYAYVNHRAYSAGALIALATDGIYMRPSSVLGAATPVSGEGEKAPEKIVSAMRSEMRALAEERGLDPRVAEAMVDERIAIPGVIQEGKLLTLTTNEAVRVDYATEVADWEALLVELDLEGAETFTTDVNWAEGIVRLVTHPAVAPLFLSLGFLGLLIELKTPTFGLAGAAGLASLGLFFGSHYLVGLAGWEELILLGVGLALLTVEVFIVPGFGFVGLGGIAAVLGSIYLSLVGHLATGADYSQAAGTLSATIVIVLVSAWALMRRLPTARRLLRSGILLGDATSRDTGYTAALLRAELVGRSGVAATDLRPAGAGQFGEERVDVVAESGWIPAGTPIVVVRAEGYRHVVRTTG